MWADRPIISEDLNPLTWPWGARPIDSTSFLSRYVCTRSRLVHSCLGDEKCKILSALRVTFPPWRKNFLPQ